LPVIVVITTIFVSFNLVVFCFAPKGATSFFFFKKILKSIHSSKAHSSPRAVGKNAGKKKNNLEQLFLFFTATLA